jgi:pSer/pThr/pTyr-binding forkhead associated (FHA) protein/ribosomal protein L40E
MIVCPNCSHTNPEGALNCEACYTALPATKACPTCGASIQLDATFCGQCGQNLKPAEPQSPPAITPIPEPANIGSGLPPTLIASSQLPTAVASAEPAVESAEIGSPQPDLPITVLPSPEISQSEPAAPAVAESTESRSPVATQLQLATHHLLHLQTNKILEIPPHLPVVHLGKPNETAPPDLDVSGLPCSEVVSRVHANIRVEGENYYIEDIGSANGTYINHNSLAKGNRHLLRSGDRISLGKGDLVTFIFQSAEKSD